MPFEQGHEKKGGRSKGTPNKRSETLLEKAKELNADPFLFLINVMAGNSEELAIKRKFNQDYDSEIPDEEGMVKIMPAIKFEDRVNAAKELMPYLYGKRKPVDSEGKDNVDPLTSLVEALRDRN